MGIAEDVMKQYPTLAWLLRDPEVGRLLRDAVDPNKGFGPQEFQAKLYQTKYFKTRSQTRREYDILQQTDPQTFRQNVDQYGWNLRYAADRLGIKLHPAQITWLSNMGLQQGLDPDDPRMLSAIARLRTSKNVGEGQLKANATRARQIAMGEYYVPLTWTNALKWGDRMARGYADENVLRSFLMDQAARKYPHLQATLKQGNTMEDIFGGHRALIAEELEISPATIDFTRGSWTKVLQYHDPQTKQFRPYTLEETRRLARSRPEWWNTTNGRSADSSLTQTLLQTFGKRDFSTQNIGNTLA